MKNLILSVALLLATDVTLFAKAAPNSSDSSLNELIVFYLNVKDALTNDNAIEAQAQSVAFCSAIKKINTAGLSSEKLQALSSYKAAITEDAGALAATKNLSKQREAFALLSQAFFQFTKQANASSATLYYQYCPMKKEYWLSKNAAIKNPYFGKEMVACGKTVQIIPSKNR